MYALQEVGTGFIRPSRYSTFNEADWEARIQEQMLGRLYTPIYIEEEAR